MSKRTTLGFLAVGLLVAPSAFAQIPPGFHVVQVTDNTMDEFFPRLNNLGQCVFTVWVDRSSRRTQEIMLYDSRTAELTRLTDDGVQDVLPDINDHGTITWCRGLGPIDPQSGDPTLEIVVRAPNGQMTRLTDNAMYDQSPHINNLGQISWDMDTGYECGVSSDIFLFDGQSVVRITDDSLRDHVSHQSAEINEFGQCVWTRYDFCEPPPGYNFSSGILMYDTGAITELTNGQLGPQAPHINDRGQVTWDYYDETNRQYITQIWQRGVTVDLVANALQGGINNVGDIGLFRALGNWNIWLYREGESLQITDDPFPNVAPDINERGEMAWNSHSFPRNIRMLQRFAEGDLNCDGRPDAFDIEPFVLALFDRSRYDHAYPTCDAMLADVNADGRTDSFDIEPFIELLFP